MQKSLFMSKHRYINDTYRYNKIMKLSIVYVNNVDYLLIRKLAVVV